MTDPDASKPDLIKHLQVSRWGVEDLSVPPAAGAAEPQMEPHDIVFMKNVQTASALVSERTQDLLTSALLGWYIHPNWLCKSQPLTFLVLLSGSLQLPDGSTLALPKVATARFGNDPNKRTVCVYGHVDVQPAKLEDGWATEPYNLTDINGNSSRGEEKSSLVPGGTFTPGGTSRSQ